MLGLCTMRARFPHAAAHHLTTRIRDLAGYAPIPIDRSASPSSLALVPGDRLRFQHREDVLLDSKLAKHRCFLGEITDSVLACPQIHGYVCYIFVVYEHAACIGGDQTHNRVESSSFASAVRSKQTNHFALLHA